LPLEEEEKMPNKKANVFNGIFKVWQILKNV
jgi:hypothetical protein